MLTPQNKTTDRVISVLTPVHPPAAVYLGDAFASLVQQKLPAGWSWEWVVQEDGDSGRIGAFLPDDRRVSFRAGSRGGAAIARNLGLSRARGDLVKVLDADDQIAPGALARDVLILGSRPEVAWTTSRVLDLMPDGSTRTFEHDPSQGLIHRGAVLHHWLAHDYRAQVHPATLCIRRDLLLMLGGWMALPGSEDTGLLMALNAVSTGYFLEEVGLLYRKWSGQTTASTAHADPDDHSARMRLIEQRARTLLQCPNPIVAATREATEH